MDRKLAIKIFKQNKEFYEKVAVEFSASRSYIWPEIMPLVKYFEKGDRVLDLGCGNGRFFGLFKDKDLNIKYFGSDNCQAMIDIAKKKYPQGRWYLTNGLKLPFKDNYFDKILSIAVLHHLPGPLRQEFLKEARRVLKSKGLLILTTWSLWPNLKYVKHFLKYSFLKIAGLSSLDWADIYLVSFTSRQKRYLHHFTQKELKKLLKHMGFSLLRLSLIKRKSGQKSLLAVSEKLPDKKK